MANSRWPPVGRRFAGARSQFASAAAAQSWEETALEAPVRVHAASNAMAPSHRGSLPSQATRATQNLSCAHCTLEPACQNESEVDAGRAESGLESGALLSPESGVWLGRQRAALMARWRKCPNSLLAACGHFPMAADRQTTARVPKIRFDLSVRASQTRPTATQKS